MLLDQKSLPIRDYHKAKRLMWDPQSLDFEQDKRDWAGMDDRQRSLLCRAAALFMGGEAAVTSDLSPLMIALKREGGHLEDEIFIAIQLFEEAKHVEFFDRALREVLAYDELPMLGVNYQALFAELSSTLDGLLADHSRAAQARAVASYHMIIEGVLAETAYYGFFSALRARDLMPGLTGGLELVQRDEARHIAFGLDLLTRLLAADPALWDVVDAQLNKLMPFAQGVFVETLSDYAPNIPFDLDIGDMLQYAGRQYFARVGVLERARAV
jgi:ribonucleoside-diphosphate reductase beta chain